MLHSPTDFIAGDPGGLGTYPCQVYFNSQRFWGCRCHQSPGLA